jgi:hypothetical protein
VACFKFTSSRAKSICSFCASVAPDPNERQAQQFGSTVLLGWLAQCEPDVVCLQELKAPNENFPESALERARFGANWHGQKSWNGLAILARDMVPIATRRGLPGDADDKHSRYIEAAIDGGVVIGCVYLTNGNPARGPKFDFKLSWFHRLPPTPPNYWHLICRPYSPAIITSYSRIGMCMHRSDGGMMHCFAPKCDRPSRN